MASVDDDSIKVSVPFAIPFLGISEPTTLHINKSSFQLFMRVVVIVCTFLLFWPRLVSTWRAATGTDEEAKRKEINERIGKLEKERDATKQAGKKYAVVESTTTVNTGSEKGSAKKRKA